MSTCFWKDVFYGMVCYGNLWYGMVWYGIEWSAWYAMVFLCYILRFVWYAMGYVVKDKHSVTVFTVSIFLLLFYVTNIGQFYVS